MPRFLHFSAHHCNIRHASTCNSYNFSTSPCIYATLPALLNSSLQYSTRINLQQLPCLNFSLYLCHASCTSQLIIAIFATHQPAIASISQLLPIFMPRVLHFSAHHCNIRHASNCNSCHSQLLLVFMPRFLHSSANHCNIRHASTCNSFHFTTSPCIYATLPALLSSSLQHSRRINLQ